MSDGTTLDGSGGVAGRPAAARAVLGATEWFRLGEHERVERVLARLTRLGITEVRTGVSWADWMVDGARAWYDWLLGRLSRQASVLVSVGFTPPSEGMVPHTAAPPRNPKALADFVDVLISCYGERFSHLELWDEPDRMCRWDRSLDPGLHRFTDMLGMAAHWARRCGKRVVLGGTSRPDASWASMLRERGVLEQVDVVGVHGMPGLLGPSWHGWGAELERIREATGRTLGDNGSSRGASRGPSLWVTSVGHPTVRGEERRQAEVFLGAVEAPAERVYWAGVEDLEPRVPTAEGFHVDEREYHLGLCRADGRPKLLCRLLEEGGVERVRQVVAMHGRGQGIGEGQGPRRARRGGAAQATLITGGAGFIGTNVAERLASMGRRVVVYDNLARPGVERNAAYLLDRYPDLVDVREEDVRDRHTLAVSLRDASDVVHLAAQVAVTTSLDDPDEDRRTNIGGTMAVLEEVRRLKRPVPLLFTSTNKVYGNLRDIELRRVGERYEPADERMSRYGVAEDRPLEFCSPYGCSKGAADQYVLDYSRSYRMPTVVFRMSCIYGPHQCGTEDQGWIAHFLMRAIEGGTVTIYGDGRQVRDALYVADLVNAFLAARSNMPRLAGRAFNIGGGPGNALSLLELVAQIGELAGEPVRVERGDWRTGDQRWYVSDTRAFQRATGWGPQVSVREGVRRLYRWLTEQSSRPALSTTTPRIGVTAG